jgi:hypothetical protein
MAALQMGIESKVQHSSQLVTFIIELSEACTESRWYKEGRRIYGGTGGASSGEEEEVWEEAGKYRVFQEDNGLKHCLEVENVGEADEGFYTFCIMPPALKAAGGDGGAGKVRVKGQLVDKADLEKLLLANIGTDVSADDAAVVDIGSV